LALPLATLQSTSVVFNGVGIRRMRFVAANLALKLALTVTTYETSLVPISVTVGMTRSGSLTFDVDRYLGGMRSDGTMEWANARTDVTS
jgi:hypothetical protein